MAATITPDEERRLFALDIGFTKKAIRTLTRYDVDHFLAGCPGDPEPDGPAIAAPLPHIPAQAAVDDTPPSAPIHLREQIEHVMELQNGGTTKPSKHDDIAGDAGNGNAAPAGIASSPPPSTPNRDVQKNGAETSFGAPPPPKGDEPTTHKTGDDPGAAGTDYPGPDADNAALIRDPAVNKALPGTPEPDDAVTAPLPPTTARTEPQCQVGLRLSRRSVIETTNRRWNQSAGESATPTTCTARMPATRSARWPMGRPHSSLARSSTIRATPRSMARTMPATPGRNSPNRKPMTIQMPLATGSTRPAPTIQGPTPPTQRRSAIPRSTRRSTPP
jgi:hypothetical protein